MPADQRLRFHEGQGAAPVGEEDQDEAVPGSEARLSDVPCGDEELLTQEGVLGEELRPGASEVSKESAAWAGGSPAGGRESSLDETPTDAAGAGEKVTPMLAERREHGCQ